MVTSKLFEAEASKRFGFLTTAGFERAPLEEPSNDRRPQSIRLAYVASEARVEVSLDLAFAGEETISTRIETITGSETFGPATARKGQEVRKALTTQAQQVAEALSTR